MLDNPAFSVTSVPVDVPAPAPRTSRLANLTSYSASNIAPVSGIDEQSLAQKAAERLNAGLSG